MDWLNDVDWGEFKDYHPLFTPLVPDDPNDPKDPFYLKIAKIQTMLLKKPLWISDEYRTAGTINSIINGYFFSGACNVFYEVGDFQGLIGFRDIIPGYKCDMTFKMWDKDIWNKTLVRASRGLVDLYIEKLRLKRISSATADKRILRMGEMIGFVCEGERPDAFRWNKKFYPLMLMGKYGDNNGMLQGRGDRLQGFEDRGTKADDAATRRNHRG